MDPNVLGGLAPGRSGRSGAIDMLLIAFHCQHQKLSSNTIFALLCEGVLDVYLICQQT